MPESDHATLVQDGERNGLKSGERGSTTKSAKSTKVNNERGLVSFSFVSFALFVVNQALSRAGAMSLLTGVAAVRSLEQGRPIKIADLVKL